MWEGGWWKKTVPHRTLCVKVSHCTRGPLHQSSKYGQICPWQEWKVLTPSYLDCGESHLPDHLHWLLPLWSPYNGDYLVDTTSNMVTPLLKTYRVSHWLWTKGTALWILPNFFSMVYFQCWFSTGSLLVHSLGFNIVLFCFHPVLHDCELHVYVHVYIESFNKYWVLSCAISRA